MANSKYPKTGNNSNYPNQPKTGNKSNYPGQPKTGNRSEYNETGKSVLESAVKKLQQPEKEEKAVPEEEEIEFSISKWEKKLTESRTARLNFEQQWYTNLAFYRGDQWVQWQKSALTTSGVALVRPRSTRKRLVFNRIMPTIRREYTKLTKEQPVYFARPNTTDQADIAAAKTAEEISEYLAEVGKYAKARRYMVFWAVQCGTGFTKTEYDPISMLPVGPPEGGEGKPEEVAGMVGYSAPSPFHIFVPFIDIEDIQDQTWVGHVRTYPKEVVEHKFGKKVEATSDISKSNSEIRFRSAINIKQTNAAKQVEVKEVWVRACDEYPEGMLVVWAGETVLYKGTFPYEHGEYPFQKMNHIPSGGFYGISTTEGLIPMQKEYNLTKSQISEARDLTSKPALVVTKGSVDVSKVTAKPGQIIEYMPGADPPRRLINPDMPTYVTVMLDELKMDMDDHSAQFEISKGRTPPGVEAASAIAYLQEENDTMLFHTVSSLEEAVSNAGSQSLSLVQQFWDTTRIINTVSKTNVQGAIEFTASKLRGHTDIMVVAGSLAPRSQAAKQASVLEFIKLGVVPPEVGLKYFAMSDSDAMYNEIHIDSNQAKRENLRLARGEYFDPNDFDDNIIHVQEHDLYRKSQEYELLPDEVKEIINAHVDMHKANEVEENAINQGEPVANGIGPGPTDAGPIPGGAGPGNV
jgi:hypothetical protein